MIQKNLSVCMALLCLSLFLVKGALQAEVKTLHQDHVKFYMSGQKMDVNEILNLDQSVGMLTRLSIAYNMTRSDLSVDWLYNEEVIGQTLLPKGMRKEATFEYGKQLPGTIALRFKGPKGQIQLLSVTAEVDISKTSPRIISPILKPAQEKKIATIKSGETAVVEPIKNEVHTLEEPPPVVYGLAPFITDISVTPLPVVVGNPSQVTVSLSKEAPQGGAELGVKVVGSSGWPSDLFEQSDFKVTVPGGSKKGTFPILAWHTGSWSTSGDFAVAIRYQEKTSTESFKVIWPPDIAEFRIQPRTFRPGGTAQGSVILSEPAPKGGATIKIEHEGPPTVTMPPEIRIQEGETQANFEIKIEPMGEATFGVGTETARGQGKYMMVSVFPPDIINLKFDPAHIRAGQSTTGTVTLETASLIDETVIKLTASGPAAAELQVPDEIRIPKGQTQASFEVQVGAKAQKYFSMEARSSSQSSQYQSVMISPAVWVSSISFDPQPAIIGNSFRMDVLLDGAATEEIGLTVEIREPNTDPTYDKGELAYGVQPSIKHLAIPSGSDRVSAVFKTKTWREKAGPVFAYVKFKNLGEELSVTRKLELVKMPEIESMSASRDQVGLGETVKVFVSLTEPAPPPGVVVKLSASPSTQVVCPNEVLIPYGNLGKEFDVQVRSTESPSFRIEGKINLEEMTWSSGSVSIKIAQD